MLAYKNRLNTISVVPEERSAPVASSAVEAALDASASPQSLVTPQQECLSQYIHAEVLESAKWPSSLSDHSLEPAVAVSTPEAAAPRQTNAVNRSISDMHAPTWFALITLNSTIRATLFHPLQMALARKRVLQEGAPSLFRMIGAARRGGITTFPGTKTPIDFGPGGLRGLYRGYGAVLISGICGSLVYLFTMENMKEKLIRAAETAFAAAHPDACGENYVGHRWATAVGATCADAVTLSIVTPIAVVVGRQMTSGVGLAASNPYRSIMGTFRHLWSLHQPRAEERLRQLELKFAKRHTSRGAGVKSGALKMKDVSVRVEGDAALRHVHPLRRGLWRTVYGMRGMYQGLSAALMRVPFSGVWWGTYTTAKEGLYSNLAPTLQRLEATHSGTAASWLFSSSDNLLLNACASAFASVMTTIMVNPFSVVQIRLQSMPVAAPAVSATGRKLPMVRKRTGLLHVVSDVFRKEGIRGFYKGAPTNIGIAILDGTVFSILFEVTRMVSDNGFLAKWNAPSTATTPAAVVSSAANDIDIQSSTTLSLMEDSAAVVEWSTTDSNVSVLGVAI